MFGFVGCARLISRRELICLFFVFHKCHIINCGLCCLSHILPLQMWFLWCSRSVHLWYLALYCLLLHVSVSLEKEDGFYFLANVFIVYFSDCGLSKLIVKGWKLCSLEEFKVEEIIWYSRVICCTYDQSETETGACECWVTFRRFQTFLNHQNVHWSHRLFI